LADAISGWVPDRGQPVVKNLRHGSVAARAGGQNVTELKAIGACG